MVDTYGNNRNSTYSSNQVPIFPSSAVAVTKSNSTVYTPPIAVYVGTTGDVAIVPAASISGAAVTFTAVPAGFVLPCLASKVMSTNTTASNMIGIS